jgi:hypothetical protein
VPTRESAQQCRIAVAIGRNDYRFDPEQDYVVVDVEMIGGWASCDRITEIGAREDRNHEIIGKWHSLLNPQQSAPAHCAMPAPPHTFSISFTRNAIGERPRVWKNKPRELTYFFAIVE